MSKHIKKSIQWLLSHAITVFSCVAIIALGMGAVAYSSTSTTIGENISTGGTLTVLSNSNLATTTISGGDLIVDTDTLYVDNGNNRVGIGTTSPAYLLDVYGDLRVGKIGSAYDNILYVNTSTGKVGIGTASPSFPLSISGAGIYILNGWGTATDQSRVLIGRPDSANSFIAIDRNGASVTGTRFGVNKANASLIYTDNAGASETTLLAIGTAGYVPLIIGTNNSERIRITADGNVGIGTTSPATTLDVNGIIKTQPASSRTCNALAEGGIMYDSDDNHFYGCNGTAWVQLDN